MKPSSRLLMLAAFAASVGIPLAVYRDLPEPRNPNNADFEALAKAQAKRERKAAKALQNQGRT